MNIFTYQSLEINKAYQDDFKCQSDEQMFWYKKMLYN